MTADQDLELVLAYEQQIGRPPANLPEDHPDRWQWEYRGTKAEREALAELMGAAEEPVVIEGQESLL